MEVRPYIGTTPLLVRANIVDGNKAAIIDAAFPSIIGVGIAALMLNLIWEKALKPSVFLVESILQGSQIDFASVGNIAFSAAISVGFGLIAYFAVIAPISAYWEIRLLRRVQERLQLANQAYEEAEDLAEQTSKNLEDSEKLIVRLESHLDHNHHEESSE